MVSKYKAQREFEEKRRLESSRKYLWFTLRFAIFVTICPTKPNNINVTSATYGQDAQIYVLRLDFYCCFV